MDPRSSALPIDGARTIALGSGLCCYLINCEDPPKHLDNAVIMLPDSRALRTRFTLPAATEERVDDVVGYELDRMTPFARDQVYYDYAITAKNHERQIITVELEVVQRDFLDGVLTDLASLGVTAKVVRVHLETAEGIDTGAFLNLLPPQYGASASRSRWVTRSLAFACMVFGLAAVAVPMIQRSLLVATLEEQVSTAKIQAMRTAQTNAKIDRLVDQQRFLSDLRGAKPRVVDLLRELTQILPDGSWLHRFEVRGTRLKSQGESDVASSLIGLIGASSLFENPTFTSRVVNNQKTGLDRFVIESDITTAISSAAHDEDHAAQ